MKIAVVLIAIVFQGDTVGFEIRESGFENITDCERRLDEIKTPWLVCGETPAEFLAQTLQEKSLAMRPINLK